jgi:tetratricopeptide (TPR) repeat protein
MFARATLVLFSLLVTVPVLAQSSAASPKIGSKQALTPEQKEAQDHYKIALLALKDGDLDVASKELKEASQLDPRNSVILYNLAVVLSKKGMIVAALDALQEAERLKLPPSLTAQADDLKLTLMYQQEKRKKEGKENPRMLLGQGMMLLGCPGYEDVVQQERDLFLQTIAPLLGSNGNISYAKYSDLGDGAIKQYYKDWEEDACHKSCASELTARHPELMGENNDQRIYANGDAKYANYGDFVSDACDNKCSAPYRAHADGIGQNLRELNYDAFVYIRSVYRCIWEADRNGYVSLGSNWVDFHIELITSDGKYYDSSPTIYLGRGYEGVEHIGRRPNLMFSTVAQKLQGPLLDLKHSAGFP